MAATYHSTPANENPLEIEIAPRAPETPAQHGVSGGHVDQPGMRFRPAEIQKATLFDPHEEEQWRKRDARIRGRHERAQRAERKFEELNEALCGKEMRTLALWGGLIAGVALLAFGLFGGVL